MGRYDDYKPEILAKELMVQRERDSVFKNTVWKGEWVGEIKKKGDVVNFPGIGRTTIRDYVPGTDITRESKTTNNQQLFITQAKYFDVTLDDIDLKQVESSGRLMNTEVQEAKRALAQTQDEYLAGFHDDGASGIAITNADTLSTNILGILTEAEQNLLEAEVPLNERKYLVISPAIYTKLVLAKIVFQQTNKEIFGAGFKGSYLNFDVFISNSIKKTNSIHHCMAYSKMALALAEQIPISSVEMYRPEGAFEDAFKGLHLYGAKVTRPGEMVQLNLTPGDETVI
jgi:hypothetical protein